MHACARAHAYNACVPTQTPTYVCWLYHDACWKTDPLLQLRPQRILGLEPVGVEDEQRHNVHAEDDVPCRGEAMLRHSLLQPLHACRRSGNDGWGMTQLKSTGRFAWVAEHRGDIADDEHVKDEAVEELAALCTDFRPADARSGECLEP